MRTLKAFLAIAVCSVSMYGGLVRAGTVEEQSTGTTVWQAGVDGIEVEWNSDGSLRRISSKFSTPVEFGDRRGISKAKIIAEEKAKAAIVRFMDQSVASARVVTEVQNDLDKATKERESGKNPNVKKVDDRTLIETLTEVTSSFASGQLKGVIVLENGYDDKTEEAWVVVGISDKTIKAARDIKQMGQEQQNSGQTGSSPQNSGQIGGSDGLGRQPSEVRRSNQKDW